MPPASFSPSDLGAIALGGVAGATVRWLVNSTANEPDGHWFIYEPNTAVTTSVTSGFPTQTLIVNVLGCLLLGGLSYALARQPSVSARRILIGAATGFCGSLTTFSTFAVEVAERLRGPSIRGQVSAIGVRVDPAYGAAIFYVVVSVLLGAAAFAAGRSAASRFLAS